MQNSLAESQKMQADAKSAQLKAANDTLEVALPKMHYLAGMSPDDRAKAFNSVMQDMKADGVPMQNVPQTSDGQFVHDEDWFQRRFGEMKQTKPFLEKQLQQSEIAKNITEANMAPAGSLARYTARDRQMPSFPIEYGKEVAPIKASSQAGRQMIDNYKHPSPQGDASLILNAFKIKFPTAPDVNSLEELSKSQATPDQWKQLAAHAISGGLDQGTRDNLMRDAASTYRANYGSYKDIAEKYQGMAQERGIPLGGMTKEPSLDRTAAAFGDIEKQIGPYVPPSQRGGASGFIAKVASKIAGTGGDQSANASDKQQSYRAAGSQVSSDEVAQYAMKHGMKLSDAQNYLRSKGYAIGR